jgi:hypothetical protein
MLPSRGRRFDFTLPLAIVSHGKLGDNVRLICILLSVLLWVGSARAEDDNSSGNAMLAPCKDSVSQGSGNSNLFLRGVCAGIVDALLVVGNVLPEDGRFCRPEAVEIGQAIRVSILYLEKHPNILHQSFKGLSIAAFHEAWPCTRK